MAEDLDIYEEAKLQLQRAQDHLDDLKAQGLPFGMTVVVVSEPTKDGVLGQQCHWALARRNEGLPETHIKAVETRRAEQIIVAARRMVGSTSVQSE